MALPGLTKYEMLARDHFMLLMTYGVHEPIEPGDWSSTKNVGPPSWFNEQKFDLGREYFMKNRFGILSTNLCGLILLLAIPKGLAILRATNKSNSVETARQRYLDTILHTLSWYEVQLKNDSRSWESLQKVRKYHYAASHVGQGHNIGPITQTQVSMTTFGFAGMALIRPYLYGITTGNQKERKAFLHFWAVLNYLIGVKDHYNIGLLPIKAAEIEFDMIMRNILGPYLQLETVAFKRMVGDMIQGMSPYIDFMDYDSQMFLVKRAVGIPGYQLDVNYTREVPYGNILSPEDVAIVRRFLPRFSEKIQIFTIYRQGKVKTNTDCHSFYHDQVDPYNATALGDFDVSSPARVKKLLGLMCHSEIRLKEVNRGPTYLRHLSAQAFSSLPAKSQFNVNMFLAVISLMKEPKGVVLVNHILDRQIDIMRNKKRIHLDLNLNSVYPKMYMRGPGVY